MSRGWQRGCCSWESSATTLQSHVLPKVPGAQVHPLAHQDHDAWQFPVPWRDPELPAAVAKACTKPGKEETEQSVSCWGGCMAEGSKPVRNCRKRWVQACICLPGAVMLLRTIWFDIAAILHVIFGGLATPCHCHGCLPTLPLCHGWFVSPSTSVVCVVQTCWCVQGAVLVLAGPCTFAWGWRLLTKPALHLDQSSCHGHGKNPKLLQVKLWPLFFSSPLVGDSFA